MSYAGAKDGLENFTYLPTTVIKLESKMPVLAQWNYKILCHPTEEEIHPSMLRSVDDVKARMTMSAKNMTMETYEGTRTARYEVSTWLINHTNNNHNNYYIINNNS